jgi:tRNA U34 5-methylaminomethyl-2-thiouridine-forming methyltransferase MnmC
MIQPLLTADGSFTLLMTDLNETYHSRHGAVSSARNIYVDEGIAFLKKRMAGPINVLEVGFGTGLNALLTYEFANKHLCHVNYVALEINPLSYTVVKALNFSQFIGHPDVLSRMHDIPVNYSAEIGDYFILEKRMLDVREFTCDEKFDLIYFDVFSPHIHPELYKCEVLNKIGSWLNQNGILITPSSQSLVKMAFQDAGYQVDEIASSATPTSLFRCSIREKNS